MEIDSNTIKTSFITLNDVIDNKRIVLPDDINGDKIVSIGKGTFRNFGIKEILLPTQLTHIDINAFRNNELTNIVLPETLVYLGAHAFRNNQLRTISIPRDLCQLNDFVFANNKLEQVVFHEDVVSIGNGAFRNNLLHYITLSDSLNSIGEYSFYNNALKRVNIPNQVTYIGIYAFDTVTELWQGNNQIITIEGIAARVLSVETREEVVLYTCESFNQKTLIYLVEKLNYTVSGEVLEDAIEELSFIELREGINLKQLLLDIKYKKSMSVYEYRILSGSTLKQCISILQRNELELNSYQEALLIEVFIHELNWVEVQKLCIDYFGSCQLF